jgi:hypothetical protein
MAWGDLPTDDYASQIRREARKARNDALWGMAILSVAQAALLWYLVVTPSLGALGVLVLMVGWHVRMANRAEVRAIKSELMIIEARSRNAEASDHRRERGFID